MAISRRIVLHFPPRITNQSIVYRLAKDFDLSFNIIKASVTPGEDKEITTKVSNTSAKWE